MRSRPSTCPCVGKCLSFACIMHPTHLSRMNSRGSSGPGQVGARGGSQKAAAPAQNALQLNGISRFEGTLRTADDNVGEHQRHQHAWAARPLARHTSKVASTHARHSHTLLPAVAGSALCCSAAKAKAAKLSESLMITAMTAY